MASRNPAYHLLIEEGFLKPRYNEQPSGRQDYSAVARGLFFGMVESRAKRRYVFADVLVISREAQT